MKTKLCLLIFVFSIMFVDSFAKKPIESKAQDKPGRNATVSLRKLNYYRGEILAVRDSLIVITTAECETSADVFKHKDSIKVIKLKSISFIKVDGVSTPFSWKNVAIGTGIGAGIDVGRYAADPKPVTLNTFIGTLTGFVVSTFISAVVSSTNTEPDQFIGVEDIPSLEVLEEYARFKGKEPKELQKILDDKLSSNFGL